MFRLQFSATFLQYYLPLIARFLPQYPSYSFPLPTFPPFPTIPSHPHPSGAPYSFHILSMTSFSPRNPLQWLLHFRGTKIPRKYGILWRGLRRPPSSGTNAAVVPGSESGIGGVGNKKVTSKRVSQYQNETGWRGMYFLPTTLGVSNVAIHKRVTSRLHFQYQQLDGDICISCRWQQVSATSPAPVLTETNHRHFKFVLQIVRNTCLLQAIAGRGEICACSLYIYSFISVVEPQCLVICVT
jgi:hypothetical protein